MKHVNRNVRTGLFVLCGLLIHVVAATPATPTETLDSAHEGVSAPWRQRDTKEPCVHPLQNLHWTKWVLNHTGISFLSYYLLVQQNYPPLVSQVVVVIRNHFMHVLVRIGSLQSMHRSVGAFLQGVASHLIFGSGPDMYFDGHLRPSVCQVMKSDLHSSTLHAHPLAPSFWISLLRNLGVASYLYQAGSLFSIVLHIYLGTFLLEMSPHNRAASSKYSKGRRRFPTLLKRPARWLFYFLKTHPMSLVFLAGAIPWPFFNPLPLLVVFIIKLHTLRAHWRTLLAAILVSRLLIIPLVSLMGTVLSVWMGANNAFLLCDDIKNPASLSSNLLKSKNIQTVVVQELRLVSAIGTLIAGIGVCISLRDLKESSSHE